MKELVGQTFQSKVSGISVTVVRVYKEGKAWIVEFVHGDSLFALNLNSFLKVFL